MDITFTVLLIVWLEFFRRGEKSKTAEPRAYPDRTEPECKQEGHTGTAHIEEALRGGFICQAR